MSNVDILNQLMADIGPFAGLVGVFEMEENTEWELVLAENRTINALYDDESGTLTFYGEIANSGRESDADFLISLLQYNMASRDTGGVRLAMNESRSLFQIVDMQIEWLSIEDLKNTILNFADKVTAWQDMLAERAQNSSPQPPIVTGGGDEIIFRG